MVKNTRFTFYNTMIVILNKQLKKLCNVVKIADF